MPSTARDSYQHALSTANSWLADVGAELGTDDRQFTRRVLRAWLHTVRDRLTVDAAAKFAAQLPELMRGIYYDGWEPNRVPIKYDRDQYVQRFAWEARISPADVPTVAPVITAVLAEKLSDGQLDEAIAAFPVDLRDMIAGTESHPKASPARNDSRDARLRQLEDQVSTLADAVRSLARGLEDRHLTGVASDQVARGARLADEILMTVPAGRS